MAASRPKIKVSERSDFGSRTTRRLRREGLVPGVVYTDGKEARPFQVEGRALASFISEGHALFDLEIEGAGSVPVVVKEEQRHPVRGELMHIDCHEVKLDQAIHADVSIELTGVDDAPGVKEGGVLEHVTREITIEALPTEIPDGLFVDVSEMVIGDTVQLDSVEAPEGVTFLADAPEEMTIATLNPPPVVSMDPELEEETEVVGEDADEDSAEGAEEDSSEASGDSADGDGSDDEG
jgi:large subunit ribosomal protein L25